MQSGKSTRKEPQMARPKLVAALSSGWPMIAVAAILMWASTGKAPVSMPWLPVAFLCAAGTALVVSLALMSTAFVRGRSPHR